MFQFDFGQSLVGKIVLMRAGVMVGDYGDGRITPADYGVGLTAAFAAAQAGDTIMAKGVCASTTGLTLSQNAVKLLCEDVCIIPSGDYSGLLTISGDDNLVRGITADGRVSGTPLANAGEGIGIDISGNRNRVEDCAANYMRGNTGSNGPGVGLRVFGNVTAGTGFDNVIDRFYTHDAMYSAVRLHNAQRATLRNFVISNPGNRAMNIQGGDDIEWIALENFEGIYDTPNTAIAPLGEQPGVFTNVNPTGTVGTLRLVNYKMTNEDVVGAGFSYNVADALNLLKFQNVRRMYMDNVQFYHGANALADYPSFRLETAGVGIDPPDELYILNSMFASAFSFANQYIPFMLVENSQFGTRLNKSGVMYFARCANLFIKHSKLDIQGGSAAIFVSASHAAGDHWEIVDTEFAANKASEVQVFSQSGTSGVPSLIANSLGNMVFYNNRLHNDGAGDIVRTTGTDREFGELACTTDRNGDILFDDSVIGTGPGDHPDPGAGGPPFFSGIADGLPGRKILNVNWLPVIADASANQPRPRSWTWDGAADWSAEAGSGSATYVDETHPVVDGLSMVRFNNSGATTIADFLGGTVGQRITLWDVAGNTTIDNNSSIACTGGTDLVMTANSFADFVRTTPTTWRQCGPLLDT